VLTGALVLMTFEKVRQLGTSLLASAGIIGVILGFAAQKTLGNFIAGLQIALAQPIRIDDVVIVEDEWGWIEEITLTYVIVRIWDLRRLVVPISYFIEKPFQNWTRISADILGSVFIYADYTVPVKELRSELTRILEESQHWDKKVNGLQVTNTTAQTVEIRALMSSVDSPTAWNLRCEVREKLLEFLQKRFPECLPRTRVELKGGES
ncbi:MAG: mechanosensitive ion channel domain-containing protein, partial [Candidatus Omnitrophota bacterium]